MRSTPVLPPFQRLLDDHGAALHRFCMAQAGPHHGPDCFQDTVVAALRAYPQLRDGSQLRAWLFTIAHHKIIDHHRRAGRSDLVPDVPDVDDRVALPTPGGPSDLDLWAAVARLPDKQRSAITLRYLADLPYAEVAAILGGSEAAARQNVRAGLARLRTEVTS